MTLNNNVIDHWAQSITSGDVVAAKAQSIDCHCWRRQLLYLIYEGARSRYASYYIQNSDIIPFDSEVRSPFPTVVVGKSI